MLETSFLWLDPKWCRPQSAEENSGQRLNHASIKDSEIAISLALEYDLPPVAGVKGLGFDSSTVVPAKARSLPKR